ncbi:MAG: inositol oxygenase [Gammaproteobacteria bacterium]|nr:inositol oxygenase [Gammaproteobacteria bacterium]
MQRKFRDYQNSQQRVKDFYRLNHQHQTLEFARAKRAEYARLDQRKMGIWQACEILDTLTDDSDPDTDATQIEHCVQTAEAIRAHGHPRWFILAGLVHDLGKILCLFGEPQWAVTGDTFALGCKFSDAVVYPEYFADNPDNNIEEYQTELGIYEQGVGLDNVTISFSHDEYMYCVAKDYLPIEALYMIRYHSLHAVHTLGAYDKLLNDDDRALLPWVAKFHEYDLYSKADAPPDIEALKPYYLDLIDDFFPDSVRW